MRDEMQPGEQLPEGDGRRRGVRPPAGGRAKVAVRG